MALFFLFVTIVSLSGVALGAMTYLQARNSHNHTLAILGAIFAVGSALAGIGAAMAAIERLNGLL